MSAPTLKPGTRCECREYGCPVNGHMSIAKRECPRDAVRMVTVPPGTQIGNKIAAVAYDVPMCEPCSQFHEAKHATR